MTSEPKLVAAEPLEQHTFDKPHIVFIDFARVSAGPASVVCAFVPEKAGGVVLMNATKHPEKHVEALLQLVSRLAQATPGDVQVKLVGTEKRVKELKDIVTRLGAKVAGELPDAADRLQAYFYTETGRLRVAAVEKKPEPVPAHAGVSAKANGRRRVLIVDDSKTIRQLLTMLLSQDPGLEVVGAAELPSQAEKMIEELKPDVITLDIHMPEMTGVELLKRYLPRFPIPTVMISSLSMEEGHDVLSALEVGAVDYIQKPSFQELDAVAPMIIERVRTASHANVREKANRSGIPQQRLASGTTVVPGMIIAMGASTGGTEALRHVFTRLPAEIPPIVVVQHIPAVFSKAFANRMAELCPFEVKEAENGDEVIPNRILIAPGGFQMGIEPSSSGFRVIIRDDPPVNRHRPSVDYLFDTVVRHVGKKTVGVLLTGMGRDGAAGLLKLRQSGAHTVAQDEASSVVFGMPKEAIKLGAAELVRPLDQVAETMMQWVSRAKS